MNKPNLLPSESRARSRSIMRWCIGVALTLGLIGAANKGWAQTPPLPEDRIEVRVLTGAAIYGHPEPGVVNLFTNPNPGAEAFCTVSVCYYRAGEKILEVTTNSSASVNIQPSPLNLNPGVISFTESGGDLGLSMNGGTPVPIPSEASQSNRSFYIPLDKDGFIQKGTTGAVEIPNTPDHPFFVPPLPEETPNTRTTVDVQGGKPSDETTPKKEDTPTATARTTTTTTPSPTDGKKRTGDDAPTRRTAEVDTPRPTPRADPKKREDPLTDDEIREFRRRMKADRNRPDGDGKNTATVTDPRGTGDGDRRTGGKPDDRTGVGKKSTPKKKTVAKTSKKTSRPEGGGGDGGKKEPGERKLNHDYKDDYDAYLDAYDRTARYQETQNKIETQRQQIERNEKAIEAARAKYGIEEGQEGQRVSQLNNEIKSLTEGGKLPTEIADRVSSMDSAGFKSEISSIDSDIARLEAAKSDPRTSAEDAARIDEEIASLRGNRDELAKISEKATERDALADITDKKTENADARARIAELEKKNADAARGLKDSVIDNDDRRKAFLEKNEGAVQEIYKESTASMVSRARNSIQRKSLSDDDYYNKIADSKGKELNCKHSSTIGFEGCDTTESVMKGAQLGNQALNQAGGAVTEITGQLGAYEAASEGTQSATFEAAADNARLAGHMSLITGLATAAMSAWQAVRAGVHGDHKQELEAAKQRGGTNLEGEAGFVGKGERKSEKKNGYVYVEDEESIEGKIIDRYELNEKRYHITENVTPELCQRAAKNYGEGSVEHMACINVKKEMRNAQFDEKITRMGDDVTKISSKAAQEQAKMQTAAEVGAVFSGVEALKSLAGAGFSYLAANNLEKTAKNLKATGATPTFQFDPLDPGNAAATPSASIAPPGGETQQFAVANPNIKDNPLNPFDPGGTIDPTAGVNGGPVGTAVPGRFERSGGNGTSGGGGQGGVSSASTQPASGGGDQPTDPRLVDVGNTAGVAYGSQGATASRGGGGRSRGGSAGAVPSPSDFLGKLAQFLPGNEKKSQRNGIVDYPGGNRGVASNRRTPFLGKRANLFTRVSKRIRTKTIQGAF